ncbi:MAG: amidohydrolase family protein [Acidimicrobiales bacterium]|jgi:predicted TIM-barrel fold metal-dependent hydrolase
MPDTWDDQAHYAVVSADMHAGADLGTYRDYLDPTWHEEFDRWVESYVQPWTNLDEAISKQNVARNWDSDLRQKEVESQGIVAEVLFPNTTPPFFETIGTIATLPMNRAEYERRWAGIQAHNRWLIEFCGLLPGRRRGLAQIFPNDVEEGMAEIRRMKDSGVIGGILLSVVPPNSGVQPLYHEVYDPLWALCAELELPVCQHLGNGSPGYPLDQPGSGMIAAYELNLWPHRSLWQLILGGVFERHPGVRFVMTEQSPPKWYLKTLASLDRTMYATKNNLNESLAALDPLGGAEKLTLSASEYFARNCYVGASFLPPDQLDDAMALGMDRVLWGADYPHEESTYPYTFESLRATFAPCGVADTRKMIGGNAADLFGFDRTALMAVAAQVGPKVSEVHQPLAPEHYPTDASSPAFYIGQGEGTSY